MTNASFLDDKHQFLYRRQFIYCIKRCLLTVLIYFCFTKVYSFRMKTIKETEVPSARIMIREDGIMHIHIKTSASFEIENSIEIVEAREQLAGGKKFPILYTSEYRFVTPSKEVKEYISTSNQRTALVVADAFVIGSFSQRLAAKIYLKLNKPSIPTEFFSTQEDAIEWLLNYTN